MTKKCALHLQKLTYQKTQQYHESVTCNIVVVVVVVANELGESSECRNQVFTSFFFFVSNV